MTLVVNSMRNDIVGNLHFGTTLALCAIANIGGNDLAESVCPDVQKLILNPNSNSQFVNPNVIRTPEEEKAIKCSIRKKAILCLLRLYRTNPETVDISDWVDQFGILLADRDIGVLTSALSLLLSFTAADPSQFEGAISYVVDILKRLILGRQIPGDYTYYNIPCPWLLVKCLRFLQYFRCPTDQGTLDTLNEVLRKLVARGESVSASDSVNKSNAEHAILFETCNLVILYGTDGDRELKENVLALLGRFIAVKDANIRYLGLDAMGRLARLEGPAPTQIHQATVITSLKDADVSVRKRSLDLLYVMTDKNNAETVVSELLLNLSSADASIKDDMVVKIAILAEKFALNLQWYLDTMVQVIMVAGDFVSEDVWHRIVHIITNHPDLHEYAAAKMITIVQSKFAPETAVALAGYVLGEFGVNICERPGNSGYDQFVALQQHFSRCQVKTCALLLTAYAKIMNLYPDCKDIVMEVFHKQSTSGYLELQQRACEYMRLPNVGSELMENVLNSMPMYPENRDNVLLQRLNKGSEHATTDKSAWETEKPDRPERPQEHTPTASAGASIVKQVAAEVDLLSLDDDTPVSNNTNSGVVQGLSEDILPSLRKWFNSALISPPGKVSTLFENSVIQITTQSEYRAHQGRVLVLFHNKTDEIQDLNVSISSSIDYLRFQKNDPAPRISLADQTKMALAVESVKPFSEAPEMIVSFTEVTRGIKTRYSYPLRLPITATSFFEPIVLEKNDFMQRWKALEGEDKEVQEVFTSSQPISSQLIQSVRANLAPALHLGLGVGLDTDFTVTACASFRTGTPNPEGGGNISVGTMMRLEGDAAGGRFRITVRSKHKAISLALKNVVKSQLS
eukprot:CAMPEP_0174821540 /NCGR_PEP_ID=MMETSP1107-20130205/9052_1 /TAXON_ID=36770 /ORGANISM="Paraphysomonas vestita, Strain GFlagA" /LENGTH=853 /DNA_ID=CAMNT_0016038711 /DNA_START=353 /DNA_END=2914 /DNA_ORIENTATION=-